MASNEAQDAAFDDVMSRDAEIRTAHGQDAHGFCFCGLTGPLTKAGHESHLKQVS